MNIAEVHELFLKSAGICTDTRKLEKNQIFFALKGDNFNGNLYAARALEAGASLSIIDEEAYELESGTILVVDVLAFLQELAAFHRNYVGIPIIAITGSNGKTTSKELIYTVLAKKYKTYATYGNLNNHIGVPLSLLSINTDHELAIIEMGANHQKEIEGYCKYTRPNYGMITNIGKAHLEGFGGIEGVIKGKTELYESIEEHQGLIFYNIDDPIIVQQSRKVNRKLSYGEALEADYSFSINHSSSFVELNFQNELVKSHLIGKYNGVNMGAAVAIGRYFKVADNLIKEALEAYIPENNRSQIVKYKGNQIILDAYNANPTSMMAALQSFSEIGTGKKAVFLGAMFEVGEESLEEHQKIVEALKEFKFDLTVLVGKDFLACKTPEFHFFESTAEAKTWFDKQEMNSYSILIKGSRGMKMESLLA